MSAHLTPKSKLKITKLLVSNYIIKLDNAQKEQHYYKTI